jgi:acetolactate synthase I/II/III large subunit
MTLLTGGGALVRMLQAYGVEFAFGMGGFQALPYYDALARQDQIRHILIRDEKNGAFAADGYARMANRAAVVDATLGPGATNLISGLAEAFGASMPMVAITGEVNTSFSGRGATQESDQFSMLRPTCKASIYVPRIERIPELVRRGFALANGGRPGPINLDIPEDVFHAEYDFDENSLFSDSGSHVVAGRRVRPSGDSIEAAAALLRKAVRPVVLAGGGVHLSEAYIQLKRLVDLLGVPVATTISGKGSIAEVHPLSAGICGRYSRFANELITEADCVLVVGSKLGEIATNRWSLFRDSTKLIQIDIDSGELVHAYTADVGVWADAQLGLSDLADALEDDRSAFAERAASSRARVRALRKAWLASAGEAYRSDDEPIHMARLLGEIQHALPEAGVVVADGGFAAHWSALLYDVTVAGRGYVANRGHAAIGYGVPGALGVKLAAPDRPVLALCGDNGFAMAMAELETAKRVEAPILCVVVNNMALGYVKALQSAMYADRFISVDFEDVDYVAAARALGCAGQRVDRPEDLGAALREALIAAEDLPYVLDVRTTTDPLSMLPGVDSRTTRPRALAT